MKVIELKKEMDSRFDWVDARFAQVDARFVEIEQRIDAEGERTRRHFDIVAERMQDGLRLVLEKVMAIGEKLERFEARNEAEHEGFRRMLDDQDIRLKAVERRPTS
jgi:hypothetical protein